MYVIAETFVACCRRATVIMCVTTMFSGCNVSKGNVKSAGETAAISGTHSYSTTFRAIEKPISESGTWIGGGTAGASLWAGRLWGDVETIPGFAFGVDEPTKYGDPTAILAGSWGPEQTASATVRIRKIPTGKCCHEVELRLRTTISNHSIIGYEAYCSVMPDQPYCHIARWNGPNGSYWNFETGSSTIYLRDGDVVSATVTGRNPTSITFYRNGALILRATDTGAAGGGFAAFGPWTTGNPGIGFYDNNDSNWKDFGFSSFSARDGNKQ